MQKPILKKPKIKIEKACNKDLDSIIKLEKRITPHTMNKAQYAAEFLNPLSHFYVACISETGEIVGYLIFWIIENILEIHQITVSPEYQRKGIGSLLMQFILDQAEQNKIVDIFLEVRRSNTSAIQFYQRFAMKKKAVRKDYYQKPAEDALIFRKRMII
jgi:ribosomal-protein-alanine N-acetyltransferase